MSSDETLLMVMRDQDMGNEEELHMEIALLKDQLNRAERRIEELTALADRDPLVGVLNPRAFTRELARAVAGAARHGHSAALVVIDIDGLSQINRQHGRGAGDAALAHVGRVVSGHVRTTDAVGRLREDEFAVLLAFADTEGTAAKMEKLVAKIAETPLQLRNGAEVAIQVRYAVAPVDPKLGASEQLEDLNARLLDAADA